MSLLTALYSGASGLDANTTELSVVGDNIANANTIGFKAGRASFADAVAQSLIGGSHYGQLGLGTRLQLVQKMMTQGSLLNTGVSNDLGIQGGGFFVVSGQANGQQGDFYTRAGQFSIDSDGFLVNLNNLKVQGYLADSAGVINTAAIADLPVGTISSPPRPSSSVTMRGNLQADAPIPASVAFDPLDAANTSNFSSSTTVFDSLGKPHQIDLHFRRNGAGTWEWHGLTNGSNLTGGVANTPTEVASGTLTYDTEGRLTAATSTSNFLPIDAVNPQALAFDFGDPTGAAGTGLAGITQFAGASSTDFLSQDGFDAGTLVRVATDTDGVLTGVFSNGQIRTLGQIALATFEAADQLERIGGNLLTPTRASGPATVGVPASSDRGTVVSGTLEQSNVDLAGEFIRMIAAQRGFQANSKTLTTADQLLAELMTIKR
jgi:flagellar hook protein FlgE